jgi:hypothetical protein
MFLHFVSDLALLCRLSTKDLLEKVPSDPLQKEREEIILFPLV